MTAFVGRRAVLDAVEGAARDARGGEPRAVLVTGPPGMGKTRLLDKAAADLGTAGMRVLRAACVELGTEGLPLAPVITVLRRLVDDPGPDALRRLLPGVDGLLRLLPEQDPEQQGPDPQARLFDLFTALLRELGAQRPVALLIDDLQWADRSTRDLLEVLVRVPRPAPLLFVVTCRSGLERAHPVRAFLARWARLDRVGRTTLKPLSRTETAELVAAADAAFADRVYRRSGGNPLYARELASASTAPSPRRSAPTPRSSRPTGTPPRSPSTGTARAGPRRRWRPRWRRRGSPSGSPPPPSRRSCSRGRWTCGTPCPRPNARTPVGSPCSRRRPGRRAGPVSRSRSSTSLTVRSRRPTASANRPGWRGCWPTGASPCTASAATGRSPRPRRRARCCPR
ncbi:MAG: ATP-binding protein [Actinomadura sp.]